MGDAEIVDDLERHRVDLEGSLPRLNRGFWIALTPADGPKRVPTVERRRIAGNSLLEVTLRLRQPAFAHGSKAKVELDHRVGRSGSVCTLEPPLRLLQSAASHRRPAERHQNSGIIGIVKPLEHGLGAVDLAEPQIGHGELRNDRFVPDALVEGA